MNTGDPALKNPSPLLHWLLRKHPDTPKTRAKQWITAGRVSVDGVIIRKPHQIIPDPGDSLELLDRHATTLACGSGWAIEPRSGKPGICRWTPMSQDDVTNFAQHCSREEFDE